MSALTAGRLIYGSLLLVAPGLLLDELPHRRIDRRTRLVARTLGVRNLVEAAVLSRRRSRGWLLAGAATDGAHAATMAALAARDRRRRPLAIANALAAATLAAAALAAANAAPAPRS